MSIDRVAVVGAGRVGLTLARALHRSGVEVALLGRAAGIAPEPLGPIATEWEPLLPAADIILLALPDDAIVDVATAMARMGVIHAAQVVLHTSGLHDARVLSPLRPTGAALGSWHPLQTFANRDGEPDALAGSPAVIEGDGRALIAGRELAQRLALAPVVEVPGDRKASYHAAAVMASNYVVVLADIASRLAGDAGIEPVPPELFLPLMRRSVDNLHRGAVVALTGPIRRGDSGTVARHLDALEGPERAVYISLGREALRLAREAGLDGVAAQSIEELLY